MGFFANGAERHRAGCESLHDFARGLDFVDRQGLRRRPQFHESAQSAQISILLVDQIGEFLKSLVAPGIGRVAQLRNRLRIQQMVFAVRAVLVIAAEIELGFGIGDRTERALVFHLRFARQYVQADAFDAGSRARKVAIDHRLVQADRFERLRAAIALQGRDAHLRENFQQPFVDRLFVILERGSEVYPAQAPTLGRVFQSLDGQVWIDGAGPVADQEREMHHFAGLARFDDQRALGARRSRTR